ncbi:MAG: hypothetical protein JKY31_04400 [Rhodobacteraceae bacterium]|nr:hypothetical protein [Paracoccaceae bacterium]
MTKNKNQDEPTVDVDEDATKVEAVEDVVDVEGIVEVAEIVAPEEITEDPSVAPETIDDDTHDDDEHHVSLAARSLQILALMVFGAVVGIGAAPKIAPLLPSGMSGISQWLSPSNNAAIEDVDLLRSELETRLARLETLPTRSEIETRLANFHTDTVNPVRTQMTALSDQVAASDSIAVESRLWALEGRVEGLIAEINGLTSSLGNIAAEGGAISADTLATISAYRTRIDGLQAEITEVLSQQGALSQKIDEVAATAERQVTEAETLVTQASQETASNIANAERSAALAEIELALKTGLPFIAPLERVALGSEIVLPDRMIAIAPIGVSTLDALHIEFVPAAYGAIRAEIAAESTDGLLGSMGSFFKSQVATRSLTEQEGSNADAVLSRMEAALLRNELAQVIAEGDTLSEPAKAEMASWLAEVAQRNQVATDLAQLKNALGVEG